MGRCFGRILLSIPLGLFLAASAAWAKPTIEKKKITSGGKERSYFLFVPEHVGSERPAPVLVLLHGQGRSGSVLVEAWKTLASREGIILVGPNALGSAWLVPQDGPDFLRDVIEEVKASYPVQPRRVYLFGHSAGAVMALYLSLLESEYFAATAVSAGVLRTPEEKRFLNYVSRNIPIALFVGTNDPFFPLSAVRETRDALLARGIPAQLTEIPGHNHNYYSIANDINARAWEFLKQIELQADPRYTQYR